MQFKARGLSPCPCRGGTRIVCNSNGGMGGPAFGLTRPASLSTPPGVLLLLLFLTLQCLQQQDVIDPTVDNGVVVCVAGVSPKLWVRVEFCEPCSKNEVLVRRICFGTCV